MFVIKKKKIEHVVEIYSLPTLEKKKALKSSAGIEALVTKSSFYYLVRAARKPLRCINYFVSDIDVPFGSSR